MSEESIVREALMGVPLPKDVRAMDFSFSEDSTGMPAVWVRLHVVGGHRVSAAKVRRLGAAKNAISRQILDSEAKSWPYVRLIPA